MVSIGIGVKVLAWPVSKKLKLIEPCVCVDCGRIMMTTIHHFIIQPNHRLLSLWSGWLLVIQNLSSFEGRPSSTSCGTFSGPFILFCIFILSSCIVPVPTAIFASDSWCCDHQLSCLPLLLHGGRHCVLFVCLSLAPKQYLTCQVGA